MRARVPHPALQAVQTAGCHCSSPGTISCSGTRSGINFAALLPQSDINAEPFNGWVAQLAKRMYPQYALKELLKDKATPITTALLSFVVGAGRGDPVSGSTGALPFGEESDSANAYAANDKARTRGERDSRLLA
jgi:hypothetical protein